MISKLEDSNCLTQLIRKKIIRKQVFHHQTNYALISHLDSFNLVFLKFIDLIMKLIQVAKKQENIFNNCTM